MMKLQLASGDYWKKYENNGIFKSWNSREIYLCLSCVF